MKPCMLPSCPGDTIPGFRTEAGLSGTVSHNSEFISWLNFRIPRNFGPPHLHVSGGFEDRGITQ